MSRLSFQVKIFIALFISIGLPIAGSIVCASLFPEWRLPLQPLHSMLESVGGIIALVLAGVLLVTRRGGHVFEPVLISSALILMGVLDIFHASVQPGKLFVWFHSAAQFFGGFLFALVALPKGCFSKNKWPYFLATVFLFSFLFGWISFFYPEGVPNMVVAGEFTMLAKFLNIMGGVCFLVAAIHFIFRYHKSKNNGDYLFVIHTTLFGMAGILFEVSVLWDAAWWWWHILRLVAYIVGFSYAVNVFVGQGNFILLYNERLRKSRSKYKRAQFEAEQASLAKSEFLSQMSHELRTPLNAIIGFSQLILLDKIEPVGVAVKQHVVQIEKSGKILLGLINQVLELSKVELGKQDVSLERVDLKILFKEILEMMVPIGIENKISIENNICSEEDLHVLAERFRLKQIFLNLITNAIKYNVKGGNVLLLYKQYGTGEGVILVRDTGVGIPEGEFGRIFDPFERLSMDNSGIPGTGVGLSITKKLVDMMDGRIWVESVVGRGTTFYVAFPLSERKKTETV